MFSTSLLGVPRGDRSSLPRVGEASSPHSLAPLTHDLFFHHVWEEPVCARPLDRWGRWGGPGVLPATPLIKHQLGMRAPTEEMGTSPPTIEFAEVSRSRTHQPWPRAPDLTPLRRLRFSTCLLPHLVHQLWDKPEEFYRCPEERPVLVTKQGQFSRGEC